MASSTSREREALLGGTSQLNPLATSFTYKPTNTSSSTSSPAASTSQTTAPSTSQLPPNANLNSGSEDHDDDEHHHEQEWASHLRRAHTLSPHTPSYVEREPNDSASDFSYDSEAPTKVQFRRAHLWVQFPISALVTLGFTAGLGFWQKEVRWLPLGLGATGWLATEALKEVVFEVLQRPSSDQYGAIIKGTGMGLPTVVHAILQEFIRLGAVVMAVGLLPEPITTILSAFMMAPMPKPHDPPVRVPRQPLPPLDTLFFSALWVGAGWSIAEILWNSRDFWLRMSLYFRYDDVLDDEEEWDEEEAADDVLEQQGGVIYGRGQYGATALSDRMKALANEGDKHRMVKLVSPPGGDEEEDAAEAEEQAKIDARIRELEREEVEAQLGVPLYEIPVAVVIVWRLDSILLALVLTLFQSLPFRTTSPSLVAFPLWPTFFVATVVRCLLSLLWVQKIPYFGIPSVSYFTLVLLVALLFGVLAAWGALE